MVKNAALHDLGPKEKGKDLIPSGGDKIHKISEQLLSFGIIRIRSRCHYYDVNLTPKFCLALKKCGHASQWFLLGVNLLHDIYTVTQVRNILQANSSEQFQCMVGEKVRK